MLWTDFRWGWTVALILLLAPGSPVGAAPLGTGVTYQGELQLGGAAADGVFDFRFSLYDASAGGSELAAVLVEDLTVADGVVSTVLDLGDHFTGDARWLQVEVRDGAATGAYTLITPRQPLRPAPLALRALAAGHAASAATAATASDVAAVDGYGAAALLAFGGLTGVPGDLADGDDDGLVDLGCDPGEVPVYGASGWECGPDRGGYRTVVVGPEGTPTANGAALLAAMAMLPTPTSEQEGWRLRIEPGRYDLGTASLVMKPWVTLVGAGEGATFVTSAVCGATSAVATVRGTEGVVVRDLAVGNTCATAEQYGIALRVDAELHSVRVEHVTATANGGAGHAAAVVVAADGELHRVTAAASGAAYDNVGISCSRDVVVTDSTGSGTGGALAVGMALGRASPSEPSHLVVSRGTFTGAGPTARHGIYVASATADLELVTVSGTFGISVVNELGDNSVYASRIVSTGAVMANRIDGDLTLRIDQSRIMAVGPTIVDAGLASDIRIAATQLWGDAAAPTATCAGVWDETWFFRQATCP